MHLSPSHVPIVQIRRSPAGTPVVTTRKAAGKRKRPGANMRPRRTPDSDPTRDIETFTKNGLDVPGQYLGGGLCSLGATRSKAVRASTSSGKMAASAR